MGRFSRPQTEVNLLHFLRKKDLTLDANCLLRRQSALSVRSYFLGKSKIKYFKMSSAKFVIQHAKVLEKGLPNCRQEPRRGDKSREELTRDILLVTRSFLVINSKFII